MVSASPRAYLLALPTWAILGGCFVVPLLLMLLLSFARRSTYGGIAPIPDLWSYVASGSFLANYARSLQPIYLQIYWRSLWLALLTTAACVVVSYPMAYWLALRAPWRWKTTLLALVVIPFWTSFLIRTYAWMVILRTEGLLNVALLRLGIVDAPLPLLYNDFAVPIGLVYGELPFMILPLYASLEKLDRSLLEAGADLGAGEARHVLARHRAAHHARHRRRDRARLHPRPRPVRRLRPARRRQDGAGRQPGAEPVRHGAQPALRRRRRRRADGGRAAVVVGLLELDAATRWRGAAVSHSATKPRPHRAARWRRALLAGHAWAVYLFLYAPILVLVLYSFNRSPRSAAWTGFTFDWYRQLLANRAILRAVENSLLVALATTAVTTVAGTLVALALARFRFAGKGATQAALYLPVIVPEVVIGAALVTFFGAVHLRLSLATVVIAHVAFCLSYVAIVVRARLAGFDRALEEAAADLGAGAFDVFRRVTLPLIAPGVLAGALLVFTVSLDDYVVTSFVAGVGSTTLPLQIYSMLKVGVTPEVNAVSTLLLGVTVVLIAVAQRLQRSA